MTDRNPCRPGGDCPVCNDVEDICPVCEEVVERDPSASFVTVDWRGRPLHAECEDCDCGLGEPHRIADCCREDREVGSDE